MTPTNLNTKGQFEHSGNGGFYLLLVLFLFWFMILVCWKHAKESILPIQIIENQKVDKKFEVPAVQYLLAKPGIQILKGDIIGTKADSAEWSQVNILEKDLSDYTGKQTLLKRIKDIRTGVDSIDQQLKLIIASLQSVPVSIQHKPKERLEKVIEYITVDNRKAIAKAEEKLKQTQSRYAQKKVEYSELLKASQELTQLKQQKPERKEVTHFVKVKSPVIALTEESNDDISAKSEQLILELIDYIKEWKKEDTVFADREGILSYSPAQNSPGVYYILTKSNKRIYAFCNPGIVADDSIKISLLNVKGQPSISLNAVKDTLKDRFIILDQDGQLEKITSTDKNARISYKEPGQTYYSWLKDKLSYR